MADSNRSRGLRLLVGGALGGVVGGTVAVVVAALALPPLGAQAAVLGAAAVLVFFALGQSLQVIFAEASPPLVMLFTMVSYVLRVVGLGVLGWWSVTWQPDLPGLVLGSAMIITVIGWLGAEIWVFTRLRIPAYDLPQAKTD
jgi:hypothetical protein